MLWGMLCSCCGGEASLTTQVLVKNKTQSMTFEPLRRINVSQVLFKVAIYVRLMPGYAEHKR